MKEKTFNIDLFLSPEDNQFVARLHDEHSISALGDTIEETLKEFCVVLGALESERRKG